MKSGLLLSLGLASVLTVTDGNAAVEPDTGLEFPDNQTISFQGTEIDLCLLGSAAKDGGMFRGPVYAMGLYVADPSSLRHDADATLWESETVKCLTVTSPEVIRLGALLERVAEDVGKRTPNVGPNDIKIMATLGLPTHKTLAANEFLHLVQTSDAGMVIIDQEGSWSVPVNSDFAAGLWEAFIGPQPVNESIRKLLIEAITERFTYQLMRVRIPPGSGHRKIKSPELYVVLFKNGKPVRGFWEKNSESREGFDVEFPRTKRNQWRIDGSEQDTYAVHVVNDTWGWGSLNTLVFSVAGLVAEDFDRVIQEDTTPIRQDRRAATIEFEPLRKTIP